MLKPDEELLKFYRSGLESLAALTEMSLTSAERFHAQQLKSIKENLADNAEVRKAIELAKDLDALREIQAGLTAGQLGKAASYWNGMYSVVSMTYIDVMRQMQIKVAQMSDELRKLASGGQSFPEPALAAWQSMVNAASNTYATTAKAAEQASRMAAAQVESVSATVRAKSAHSGQKSF